MRSTFAAGTLRHAIVRSIFVVITLVWWSVAELAALQDPVPVVAFDDTAVVAAAIRPHWTASEFVSSRDVLELTFNRRLEPGVERVAMLIGTQDVSALLEVRGTRVRYAPVAMRLPAGQTEVVAWIVSAGEWQEIGRFPLNVRTRFGLDQGSFVPSADLSSDGRLDERVPDGLPAPERRTYQDVTMRLGAEAAVARDGWNITVQGNALGVTQETQRLRWSEMQLNAPAVDLADYRVQVARGPAQVALGNIAIGSNRYLLNGFASRGASGALRIGRFATVDAGVVNGTNVVGWSNPFGITRPTHRMSSFALGLELMPGRPGAMHVDVTAFDGSLLPRSSFNQGAATDAEKSRGIGAQFALSDAGQRIRLSGGYARSRFINPFDPLLAGDTSIVAVRTTTRDARNGELTLHVLRDFPATPSIPVNLVATARHERVEPLYRSVGAYVRADGESNGMDLNASIGALVIQGMFSRARDNLDGIESVLSTRTHSRALSGAFPLGSLARAAPDDWYWPSLTVAWQQVRQFGDAVPLNGDFAESHVPDQYSTNRIASATWQHVLWSLTWAWNESHQDNRQVGRERADFRSSVHAVSIGVTPHTRIRSAIDLSTERQHHYETATTQKLKRLGGNAQLQITRSTALSGSISYSRGEDPFAAQRTRNAEYNAELAQGFTLYGRHDGGTQGRVYVRYARTRAALHPFEPIPLVAPIITWSLTAGASFRLY